MALLDPGSTETLSQLDTVPKLIGSILVLIGIVVFNGIVIGIVITKLESYLTSDKEGYGEVIEHVIK